MPNTPTNHPIGFPLIELHSVDSTNNYAMAHVKKGLARHGTAYFAYHQKFGKGRRGKDWQSRKGQNIILSVVLNTSWLPVSAQFHLIVTIAMGVHDFFNKYATNSTTIKWPNDIYWSDRKAAGILIENVVRGNKWQWAVAGIGLNVNQTEFNASLTNPVSLKQITGKTFNVIQLTKELCCFLETRYQQLFRLGIDNLIHQYNDNLYKKNELIELKKEGEIFCCILKEVNHYGQLIATGASKNIFEFNEVEWLIS